MRRYHTVSLYVVREVLSSFVIAFLFFFFIFFVNQLLLMAENILSKKVPLEDVLLIVFYSLPIIFTYSLPFGTLVGALMAVGDLSASNQILAFRAAGISLLRILLPILFLGIALSFLVFVFNDFFLPLGNIRLKTKLKQVLFQNPSIELESYSIKKYDDTVLITGKVEGRRIGGLVIVDEMQDNKKRIITAENASLVHNPEQWGEISLKLDSAFVHISDPTNEGNYEYSSAESLVYNLLLKDISVSMINPGPAEKSSADVWIEIQEKKLELQEKEENKRKNLGRIQLELAMQIRETLETMRKGTELTENQLGGLRNVLNKLEKEAARPVFFRELQTYSLEFHRKFSSPLSCAVFIFFAFPVGLFARRSGKSVGFGIGIIMSAVYWSLLLISFRVGSRVNVSAFLAMWMPNMVVFIVGGFFLLRSLRR